MNAYPNSADRTPGWAQALFLSVIVHLVLAAIFVALVMLDAFVVKVREVIQAVPEPEVFLEISPEMFTKVTSPEPEAPVAPASRDSFVPTSASQESEDQPKSTRYFGERNTTAASSAEALDEALPVPSQEGEAPRVEGEMELLDTDFADGETNGAPGTAGDEGLTTTPLPEPVASEMEDPSPLPEPEVIPVEEEPNAADRLERAKEKAQELLSLEDSVPGRMKENIPEPKEEPAPEEKIPEPKEKQEPKEPGGGRVGEKGTESGFEREARKTLLQGSIRRTGESALDVDDTLRGRYLAEVNKQIEKAWQRECVMRREHVLPGVLTVRFEVTAEGVVQGFRFGYETGGSAIQKGFTMTAVKGAELPAMSGDLKAELEGEPLEMMLTFYF